MKNIYKKILASILFTTGMVAQAQISYESSDYASSGDAYFISEINQVGAPDGLDLDGEDVSWDFSDLVLEGQSESEINDPTLSIYATTYIADCVADGGNVIFCTAEWALLSSIAVSTDMDLGVPSLEITDASMFYKKNSSKLEATLLGVTVDASIIEVPVPLIINYEPKDVVFEFPMTYGDSFNSSSAFEFDLSNLLELPITYTQNQERSTSVSGWGSITTPYQTFDDVIKVSAELVIEANAGIIPANRKEYYYSWFSKDYGVPVMEVMQIEIAGVVTSTRIRYIDEEYVEGLAIEESQRLDYAVYPNPSDGKFHINIPEGRKLASATVYDLLGNKVANVSGEGMNRSIDMTHFGLAKGVYFLRIIEQDGVEKSFRLIYK